IQGFTALNAIHGSPLTEWLWMRTRHPWSPNARAEMRSQRAGWKNQGHPDWLPVQRSQMLDRREQIEVARKAAKNARGGRNSYRGGAAALSVLLDRKIAPNYQPGVLEMAGISRKHAARLVQSWGEIEGITDDNVFKSKNLGYVGAATKRVRDSMEELAR